MPRKQWKRVPQGSKHTLIVRVCCKQAPSQRLKIKRFITLFNFAKERYIVAVADVFLIFVGLFMGDPFSHSMLKGMAFI